MGQQSGRANPICSGAICALQGGAARGGLRARFECACQANRRAESDSCSETRRLRPRCAQRRGYGNHSGRQRACMMRTPCPSPRLFLALQSGKSWPMQEHIVVAALVLRHTEGSDRDWSPRPHARLLAIIYLRKVGHWGYKGLDSVRPVTSGRKDGSMATKKPAAQDNDTRPPAETSRMARHVIRVMLESAPAPHDAVQHRVKSARKKASAAKRGTAKR
jgi:hypothetical protein